MKIPVHIVNGSDLVNAGYVEAPSFNADKCYDLCNWKQWTKNVPDNLHTNRDTYNKRLCFTNPENNEMWLTKSIGWFVGSENEIKDYINENKDELLWL